MEQAVKVIEELQISGLTSPCRLSDLPPHLFISIPSKKALKNQIKQANVHLNGEKGFSGNWVNNGDNITILAATSSHHPTIKIPLEVLYEDAYLAAINKPAGIEVNGNKKFTIQNALTHNITPSHCKDALLKPLTIHRLDYPTTGVLLVGKTALVVTKLNALFAEKKITKTYLAITQGVSPKSQFITSPVNDKKAQTQITLLKSVPSEKYTQLNLIQANPTTGRKHQIRQHLSQINTPILGDKLYGNSEKMSFGNGLYLHAYTLSFIHPITQKAILFTAPIPKKFSRIFGEIST